MKIKQIIPLLLFLPCLISASCGEDDHSVPEINTGTTPNEPTTPVEPEDMYDWEAARTSIPDYTDMVLIYGGGHHRAKYNWDRDRLDSYVCYYNPEGRQTWMFDAYLFLEIMDYGTGGANVGYSAGYKDYSGNLLNSATKADWQRLIDYLFDTQHNISQLDKSITAAIPFAGTLPSPRKVVISLPEPIVRQNSGNSTSSTIYWGEIDGKKLDFSKNADRIVAVKWFIDQCRARFAAAKYEHLELAGFYWLAEHSSNSQTLLDPIAEYLHQFKYSFNWIPYFNAAGYKDWKKYGFDYAFLQPNYFFNVSVPKSRLSEACILGQEAKMSMEIEFDDNALQSAGSNCKADRLYDYMSAFRTYKVWDKQPIAYYQGNNTVHNLRVSTNEADKTLYHEFGSFVTTRPLRNK